MAVEQAVHRLKEFKTNFSRLAIFLLPLPTIFFSIDSIQPTNSYRLARKAGDQTQTCEFKSRFHLTSPFSLPTTSSLALPHPVSQL